MYTEPTSADLLRQTYLRDKRASAMAQLLFELLHSDALSEWEMWRKEIRKVLGDDQG